MGPQGIPDDPLSSALEEISERAEVPFDWRTGPNEGLARAIAGDVRRLRAALDAVLKLHQRSTLSASRGEHKGRHFCRACSTSVDDFTAYTDWPCPEVQAITRELTGEEKTNG
jgi:hypothetical protein